MQPGTYRLPSGELMRCRIDAGGAARCEIEREDGTRREVESHAMAGQALLSDDPAWPFFEAGQVSLGPAE